MEYIFTYLFCIVEEDSLDIPLKGLYHQLHFHHMENKKYLKATLNKYGTYYLGSEAALTAYSKYAI
jgi:hypothetical protein